MENTTMKHTIATCNNSINKNLEKEKPVEGLPVNTK